MRASPVHADIVVAGLGPAGRAVASRCVAAGLRVVAVDRRPGRVWTPTYGAWADEVPPWLPLSAVAAIAHRPAVFGTVETGVDRDYLVFDTAALQRSLSLVGAEVREGTVTGVAGGHVDLADGTRLRGALVVDARGAAATPARPQQTAFGLVLGSAAAERVLEGRSAWFMDWRPSPAAWPPAFGTALPSFLYAVPLGGDEVLVEETCLVGLPALTVGELRRRLLARLAASGVRPTGAEPAERVRFAVHAPRRHPAGVLAVGTRGGLTHPATGYGVAASLHAAQDVAAAAAAGEDPRRALWPRRARVVAALRLAGLNSLLRLPPHALPGFFDAFFALPVDAQRAYLSSRTDAAGLAGAMARVFRAAPGPVRARLALAVAHSV